jgi:hypothetical protein
MAPNSSKFIRLLFSGVGTSSAATEAARTDTAERGEMALAFGALKAATPLGFWMETVDNIVNLKSMKEEMCQTRGCGAVLSPFAGGMRLQAPPK